MVKTCWTFVCLKFKEKFLEKFLFSKNLGKFYGSMKFGEIFVKQKFGEILWKEFWKFFFTKNRDFLVCARTPLYI